jgi:iron complex outermembrane receptor protein
VLGGYYFREKGVEVNPQTFAAVTGNGVLSRTSVLAYRHVSETKALFAQSTGHVTDKFSLTAGARYTWDEKRLSQTSPFTRTLSRSFSKFNWAGTADYQVTPEILAYARVATGYKAGGFNARSTNAGFGPENLISYEAGLKSEFFERRLRFNTALFYSDLKDVQVSQFQAGSNGATSITTNAGKARFKGVEVEVNAVPVDGLTTYATLGYVDRTYKRFIALDPASNLLVDIANGQARFTYSPKVTLNVGAQYQFPALSFGVLTARLDYSYRSGLEFGASPYGSPYRDMISAPGRGLLDARLTLSELPLGNTEASLSLWGKNITDKKYRTVGIDFGALGFATNAYGEPATFGVDLTVKY